MSARHRSRGAVLLALILSLLMLAGCGGSSGSDGSSDKGGAGNTDVAKGGKNFSTADEETAKLGSDAEPGEFPRTIKHAAGETTIEKQPERVVVLDTGELDAVVSLGLTPVGMVTTGGENPVPSYLADKVEDVESVGTINELNLEAIAALKPDLILGSQLRADKLYAQLAEIAPTVFSIRPGFPWKENFLLAGEALGMENEATEKLNEYAAAVEKLNESVEGDPKISLVRFMPGKLRLYANKSLIGVILKDAGLSRPAVQDIDDLAVEISPENISQAEGDFVFYSSYGAPDATGESTVINGAGWKALAAVQAGKAQRVDDDVWFLGLGPTGAALIVEQLGDYLK